MKNDLAMGQLITFYNALIFNKELKTSQKLFNVLVKTALEAFESEFLVIKGGQANS